jgi:hypothetical protein
MLCWCVGVLVFLFYVGRAYACMTGGAAHVPDHPLQGVHSHA